MGYKKCCDHHSNNPKCPSHISVISKTKAYIKDRETDSKKDGVDHPHQNQNLDQDGYSSQVLPPKQYRRSISVRYPLVIESFLMVKNTF